MNLNFDCPVFRCCFKFQIFRLIQRINSGQTSEELFDAVKDKGITEDDFKAYLIYCTGNFYIMIKDLKI